MKINKTLQVLYKDRLVGTLALTKDGKAAFEYDEKWLVEGFSISPFSLPLEKKVYIPTKNYFHGLFGVFADSLPDAWGNILLNRVLNRNGINPGEMSALDRLAIVGNSGMGALTYRPSQDMLQMDRGLDLDYLAQECRKILDEEYTEELDQLYRLGGTSGGARPKILTQIEGEDWIIKFPAHIDGKDSGKMEYDYAVCAEKAGISMMPTRLFPSKVCKGYFGTKRFDRRSIAQRNEKEAERIHMLTAAALLELDFEQPSLDYHSLMKLTNILTRNNIKETEEMFRRMCFNVFAHNRDDHSKNFTFLYCEEEDAWRLSPAYDLTYSNTYYGEHTTSVDGNGRNPGKKDLLAVGTAAGLDKKWCEKAAAEIKSCVEENLRCYL